MYSHRHENKILSFEFVYFFASFYAKIIAHCAFGLGGFISFVNPSLTIIWLKMIVTTFSPASSSSLKFPPLTLSKIDQLSKK